MVFAGKTLEQVFNGENPVSIELDSLRANGNRKVKLAACLQQFRQGVKSKKISIIIHGVAISSQAKVFQCVQA
jgi:hypothetical protein